MPCSSSCFRLPRQKRTPLRTRIGLRGPAILKPISVTQSRENSVAFAHRRARCNQRTLALLANNGTPRNLLARVIHPSRACRFW